VSDRECAQSGLTRIFCVDMNDAMLEKACHFWASSVVFVNHRARSHISNVYIKIIKCNDKLFTNT